MKPSFSNSTLSDGNAIENIFIRSSRYGFNKQEKDNEISGGDGNNYTATFWEYDARLGRRWNLDPKPTTWECPYSTFGGNPILNIDPLGDVVQTNQEGADNTIKGTNGILDGKANPISYDKENGKLKFDANLDISKYSEKQKDILNRYKKLIDDPTVTTLHVVDRSEQITNGGKTFSLASEKANGTTLSHRQQNGNPELAVVTSTDVYVARDPVMYVTTTEGAGSIGGMTAKGTTTTSTENERPEFAGLTNLHELAGHAYENLVHPAYTAKQLNSNNQAVENFTNSIFRSFKINGSVWYKGRTADQHIRYQE